MRRLYQVFSAPEGAGDWPDEVDPSPWIFPDEVRLPMEHWDALLAFAQSRSASDRVLLERAALLDGGRFDPDEEGWLLERLDALARAVVHAPRLTPDDSDPAEIPEPMPNSAHARMLGDVARLVRRCRASGVSFDSWVD